MAHEALTHSTIIAAIKDLSTDVSELARKEFRLARAEISAKISAGMQAGVWMAVAAFLLLIAGLLVIQAIVHAIASTGLAMHWSYLIVAAALLLVAGISFLVGRSKARISFRPERTMGQIEKDIRVVRSN